tara:strand:- start:20562 stop:21659 length:1098 start_codon:yes stop_codon:yes gene_type:complete
MGLSVGIVGLPNVGKSTIFNSMTNAQVASENYAFCTIEPNHGIVSVPDMRIDKIKEYIPTEKTIYNTIEFFDIAGLVKGASTGEGLGNKFLSHIRNVDAIIHIVRCFENNDVTHVDGDINPIRDIETINTELILKDIESIEKRIKNIAKIAKSGDTESKKELELLNNMLPDLNEGKMIHDLDIDNQQLNQLKSLALLTAKPMIYVANIADTDLMEEDNIYVTNLRTYLSDNKKVLLTLSGAIEMEISSMDVNEQKEFLNEYGLEESGLNKMIRYAYQTLQLETFFTAGPKEVRAWSIRKGSTAPKGAGVIHSDFERGFIKAEVYTINDLIKYKNEIEIKNAGKLRQEGKEYIINDGDIIFFKFNV